jgi:uncharacterized protein (DUF4415 family)
MIGLKKLTLCKAPSLSAGAVRLVIQTIRFDLDVLAAFKATGKGWQTRMNEALREWLKEHPMKHV